jgi:ABC-type nickel/cobalt efflux system permease component RcnA
MMTIVAFAALVLLQIAEARESGLSGFSWTFMLVSMGAVTALAAWCFVRILRGKRHFDPDGTGPAHAPVAGKVDRQGGV